MKRMLLKFFSLVLLMSMIVSPAIAQTSEGDPPLFEPVAETDFLKLDQSKEAQKSERYIVLLEGKSLVTYRGGIEGFNATSPSVTKEKIDVESSNSEKYLNYLHGKQDAIISAVENRIDRQLEIDFRYDVILNGFAAKMTASEAEKLAALDGVLSVQRRNLAVTYGCESRLHWC